MAGSLEWEYTRRVEQSETNEVRNTVSDHIAKHMKYSEAYEPNPSVTQTQPIAMITQQQSLTLSLKTTTGSEWASTLRRTKLTKTHCHTRSL